MRANSPSLSGHQFSYPSDENKLIAVSGKCDYRMRDCNLIDFFFLKESNIHYKNCVFCENVKGKKALIDNDKACRFLGEVGQEFSIWATSSP